MCLSYRSGGTTFLPARGILLDHTADPAIVRLVQLLYAGNSSSANAGNSSEIDFQAAASARAHLRGYTSESTGQVVSQLPNYWVIQCLAA
jgi:hypothetical protein